MPHDPRAFWTVAGGFPTNKEEVYPEHAEAQRFDQHKGKIVLEYGCGGGSDTLSYLRRGCSVIYADIVSANVLKTQRLVRESGFMGKAKPTVLKESARIALPDEFVDVANAHGVIHHISDLDVRVATLREICRVLKPGGWFYVMLYTDELWARFADEITNLVDKHGITPEEAFGWCTDGRPCPYATSYDKERGAVLLKAGGFEVESTFVYNHSDFRTFRARKIV